MYFTQHLRPDATGRDLAMTGMKMYRLADGQVVEFRGATDLAHLLHQTGVLPRWPPVFDQAPG